MGNDSQANRPTIVLGACAGHHFWGEGDLEVVRHCTQGDRRGYFHTRKWLANRAAFNYDARLGWAYDRWFEWFPPSTTERIDADGHLRNLSD